ncbi:MAG: hypothetical protein CMD16_00005, partial [Flavobacteriales bacterium]|nr:hypothetical protein [Flavobacteriales bacterium]
DSLDNSLHVNCLGGTAPYSYQWFLDSVLIESFNSRHLRVHSNGIYYVLIEDINRCRSYTDTIRIKTLEINIYPNPTRSVINLDFIRIAGEKYTISVFDFNMNILHYIELPELNYTTSYSHILNLDIQRSGLYFIRLESSDSYIVKQFYFSE